jgi:DNA-directed RNA polymerase subunit beta
MKKDIFSEMFPGLVKEAYTGAPQNNAIPAMRKGKLTYADPSEIDYEIISPSHLYTESTNLAPMMSTMKGARAFMAGKYFTQALPMAEPESPLVKSIDPDSNDSIESTVGKKIGMNFSPFDGIVKKVEKDKIILSDSNNNNFEVELRNYYPHNRKTFTTDTPIVAVGQQIKKNDPISHSNYVTKDGDLAIGKNLRVAFMPGKQGGTFEDSITISEGAAKKLTSSHLYGFDVENKLGTTSSKTKFIQLFPNKYTKEQ